MVGAPHAKLGACFHKLCAVGWGHWRGKSTDAVLIACWCHVAGPFPPHTECSKCSGLRQAAPIPCRPWSNARGNRGTTSQHHLTQVVPTPRSCTTLTRCQLTMGSLRHKQTAVRNRVSPPCLLHKAPRAQAPCCLGSTGGAETWWCRGWAKRRAGRQAHSPLKVPPHRGIHLSAGATPIRTASAGGEIKAFARLQSLHRWLSACTAGNPSKSLITPVEQTRHTPGEHDQSPIAVAKLNLLLIPRYCGPRYDDSH